MLNPTVKYKWIDNEFIYVCNWNMNLEFIEGNNTNKYDYLNISK